MANKPFIHFLIFILILLIAPRAGAETYKDTPWYKEYQSLPDSYKSERMEEIYRKSYAAEQKVKALPAIKGGTVGEFLDEKAKIPAIRDAGWDTHTDNGATEVERTMFLGRLTLIYRWRVEADGTVKAVNGKAIGITK